MSTKQVQEAYIVAATRTPIGKAPRGYFRTTRPDDLLVAAVRSALAQVPNLDPKAIEDAIVGCSFPEAEQGINMARAAMVLAGLPHSVGGVTINRFCASGITAIQVALVATLGLLDNQGYAKLGQQGCLAIFIYFNIKSASLFLISILLTFLYCINPGYPSHKIFIAERVLISTS